MSQDIFQILAQLNHRTFFRCEVGGNDRGEYLISFGYDQRSDEKNNYAGSNNALNIPHFLVLTTARGLHKRNAP
jgi:hypothetical protein